MSDARRWDLNALRRWISEGSRVLDLGCGEGALLCELRERLNVDGMGVEIDPEGIRRCIAEGLSVIEHNLDAGLERFDDRSFDVVVATFTLQNVANPKTMLNEMLRIGRYGIVTFPNYGYWRCRWRLAGRGRTPIHPGERAGRWHDLPNIRPCSIADFEDLCQEEGIQVADRLIFSHSNRSSALVRALPNLYGQTALYRIARQ